MSKQPTPPTRIYDYSSDSEEQISDRLHERSQLAPELRVIVHLRSGGTLVGELRFYDNSHLAIVAAGQLHNVLYRDIAHIVQEPPRPAALRVTIVDPTKSRRQQAELPADVPMSRLIPALVSRMGLPATNRSGEPQVYRLHHLKAGRELDDTQTLPAAGVQEDDELGLTAGVTAGSYGAASSPVTGAMWEFTRRQQDQSQVGAADIEEALRRLRGVVSARLVRDDRGEIQEVSVVADPLRHPKHVSRDIESALFSDLGVRIDHRRISIAQMRSPTEPPAEMRLKFLSIDYLLDRTTARARVSVGRGDDSYTGAASTSVGRSLDQEHLIARASLAAVEEFLRSNSLNGAPSLELQDLTRSAANGRPCVVATVRVLGVRQEDDLLGSALVRDDPWKAAALAVLDALNRRLPALCS